LLRLSLTKDALLEAMVVGFEHSDSYQGARENLGLLERARTIPEPLVRRIEVALRSNEQIAQSFGVADRVERLVRAARSIK